MTGDEPLWVEEPVRDGFSDGFFTRMAHDTHPVDLMCLYLLHGSVERIPGLLVGRETLSFKHLSQRVRAVDRWTYDDADTFSLRIKRKVRGRLYGLEFRVHFVAGEPYADAAIPFGATVDLPRFMHHFRGRYASGGAPGDWDFDVYTDVGDLRESVVLFGNHREVWFNVNRGPVTTGRHKPVPWARGRLVTGRLHGNQFGTNAVPNAGSAMFPDRHDLVEGTSAETRAYRRYVSRLHNSPPRRVGRPGPARRRRRPRQG
ncbi:hypothetical protein [Streptomyces gilvus]|uniref:hypothetical protein n=1 Tax=Streptomyces gilvus TaxID=2920937 RepID=UPI001F0F365F|nr:hypothetical protein [Streptomyces sp. CME 23]MCH5670637.1 hypothetical protein [Streptomyces sp. CME 23]